MMSNEKRTWSEMDKDRNSPQQQHQQHPKKKQKRNKHSNSQPQHRNENHNGNDSQNSKSPASNLASHEEALAALPPPTATLPPASAYVPFTVPSTVPGPSGLPPLPDILDKDLAEAPFRHKSADSRYNRSTFSHTTTSQHLTYDKLEFLGDAQIEHIASRLLYARFPHLLVGQQSQLRELLVKNETLAEFARGYNFESRIKVAGDLEIMTGVYHSPASSSPPPRSGTPHKQNNQHHHHPHGNPHDAKNGMPGNKGFNKILGDVFEAYVAAVILSHGDEGFAVAEKWLTALWAPKLLAAIKDDPRYANPNAPTLLTHDPATTDPSKIYNPSAKAELQKRLLGSRDTKIEYKCYAPSMELKGDKLGQSRHFIAVYLTGFGFVKKELGRGEGSNKVEAGNWAATDAMWGRNREVVDQCAEKVRQWKEERRREREERERQEAEAKEEEVEDSGGGGGGGGKV